MGRDNMLLRQGILAFIAVFALLLTGCALSPQQLTPKPVISDELPVVGHGQAINVRVVDGRDSEILGTRGGVYSNTSNISVSKTYIAETLQQQTEAALRKMGYVPASNNPTAATLTITLSGLTYTSPDSYYVRSADVGAELKSTLQTNAKVYNGHYTASASQSFGSTPDLETNNTLVADVLARALKRLLTDNNLTGNF